MEFLRSMSASEVLASGQSPCLKEMWGEAFQAGLFIPTGGFDVPFFGLDMEFHGGMGRQEAGGSVAGVGSPKHDRSMTSTRPGKRAWAYLEDTVDSKKLEYGFRVIDAGLPSVFLTLGSQDGRIKRSGLYSTYTPSRVLISTPRLYWKALSVPTWIVR